jgi:hypothetical protein
MARKQMHVHLHLPLGVHYDVHLHYGIVPWDAIQRNPDLCINRPVDLGVRVIIRLSVWTVNAFWNFA